MKKILFSFIMLHLYVIAISGQETCLTVSSRPPQWIFNQSLRSSTSTSYRLNIFIHIVRSSKGKGLSAGIASSIINTLNNSFTNTNIQFVLHGTDFIDSDYYYNNLTDKENQLFTVNAHENAIDIYVLGTSTTWIGSGLANGIPSTALIIHGKHYNTSTLPHEMGHCLGLYHTHHGTIYEEGSDDTNQCAEFVDGSNSSICGDYISDTPADPNRWSNNSCSYIGTGVDGHGDSYTPNASNYMSYAHKPCRTLFSDLQIDRMKLFINNTPSLQQVIDYNISGPSFVCDQATYTIQNLLPGAIVQWSVNNNNLQLLSGQGTGMATFKKSNIGRTNITAEIYNNNILISGVNQLVSVGVPELYTYGDYLYSGGQPKRCFVENQANSCYLQSDQDENIDKWDWRVTSGEIFVSGLKNENATIYPRPSSPPSFMIEIRALNKCGWTDWKRLLAYAVSSGACPFSLSPNPATDEVTLQLMETDEVSGLSVLSTDRSTYEIQLWSGMTMLRSFRTTEPTFQIPMAGLPAGLYFVRVVKDGQTYTQKLIKK